MRFPNGARAHGLRRDALKIDPFPVVGGGQTIEVSYLVGLRRAFCFFDIDRMTSLPLPFASSGFAACAMAAAMSSSTPGCANVVADSILTKRFWLPLPRSNPCGSGNEAP